MYLAVHFEKSGVRAGDLIQLRTMREKFEERYVIKAGTEQYHCGMFIESRQYASKKNKICLLNEMTREFYLADHVLALSRIPGGSKVLNFKVDT